MARAVAALGRRDDARRRFEELARVGFDAGAAQHPLDQHAASRSRISAPTSRDASARRRWRSCCGRSRSLHGVLPVPVCYGGPVSRALARLAALQGRSDEAAELFDEAFASAEALGARPMAARILAEHGALLARRGLRSAARERLSDAAKRAAELDMPGTAEAATTELARLG